ncbi:MAG: lipase family protein [Candidatus Moduliflexus flocculans]|nr:lipase family protein [Candidatus Moduliflexus flocculans]
MTNANFWLTDWTNGSKVHRGFKSALEEVWDDLFPYLKALQGRGCRIWMTGHSLGAALATLAADRYGEVQGVYTFGSPRVGNGRFNGLLDPDLPVRQRRRHRDWLASGRFLCACGRAEVHRSRRAHPGPARCRPGLVLATVSPGSAARRSPLKNGGPPESSDFHAPMPSSTTFRCFTRS